MRRFIAVFVALLIALLALFVAAHAETNEEAAILFRNNQWGTSLPSVLKSFPDEVRFFDLRSDNAYQVEKTILEEGRHYFNGNVCGYVYVRPSSLMDMKDAGKDMKVAGYEVSDITLRFAWVPGDDGLIVEDDEHTALYFAQYKIEPKDPEAVLTDLTNKLTSLYGEPDSTKKTGSVIIENYTIWYGGEGTILALVGRDYGSGNYEIEIRYGTTEGNAMLQTAYDALILQETLDAATNVDGL